MGPSVDPGAIKGRGHEDRGATATQTHFSRLKDLRKDHGNSYGNGTELRVKPAALASTPILSFNLQQQRPRLRLRPPKDNGRGGGGGGGLKGKLC